MDLSVGSDFVFMFKPMVVVEWANRFLRDDLFQPKYLAIPISNTIKTISGKGSDATRVPNVSALWIK
jgi:hypothetical protein